MRWPWSKKPAPPVDPSIETDPDMLRVLNAAMADGEAFFERDENGELQRVYPDVKPRV